MNNDAKLIFEAYLNKKTLLNELDYGAADFSSSLGGIAKKAKAGELPGKGYLIGHIADSLMVSPEEAANMLTSAVFANLFKQQAATIAGQEVQYFNPSKNKDQFLVSIRNAIGKAIEAIKKDHPNLKIPGSEAIKGYTARVLANAGNFVTDVTATKAGMIAPVTSSKDLKVAIVKAETAPKTVNVQSPAEEKYVRSNVKFIPDFQKVFAEMPDELAVKKGENLYKSAIFNDAVKDAILQAYDEKMVSDKEFTDDLISSLEAKNAYELSSAKEEREGEGTGELPTIEGEAEQTPTEILQDLGTWSPDRGFDQYDKYSTY
jgi:hypothetical protein